MTKEILGLNTPPQEEIKNNWTAIFNEMDRNTLELTIGDYIKRIKEIAENISTVDPSELKITAERLGIAIEVLKEK